MLKNEIESVVKRQIGILMGIDVDNINVHENLYDGLGMDFLDCVELSMMLEETFKIEITDEDQEKWLTVLDIVQYLDTRVGDI